MTSNRNLPDPLSLSRRQLFDRIWSKPMTTNAAELGTRTSTLTALAKQLGLPTPRAGHWMKLEAGKAPPTPTYPADPKLDEATYTIAPARRWEDKAVSEQRQGVARLANGPEEPQRARASTDEPVAPTPAVNVETQPAIEAAIGPRKEVRATRKALLRSQGLDRMAVGGPDKFRLLVSPISGERACSMLDGLLAAIEECGWKFAGTDKGFAILADEEMIGFMIEEKLDRVAHTLTQKELKEKAEYERKCALADRGIGYRPWPPSIPTYDYVPNSELALQIDQDYAAAGIRRTFADGKRQRLEDLIPSIIESIGRYAVAIKARRLEQEEQSRQWAERERKRKDTERQIRVEGYRITFLRRQIERKREIDGLADLIARWETGDSADPKFDELLDFARLYRDWLAAKIEPEAVAKRIADLKLMDDDIYIYDEKRLD